MSIDRIDIPSLIFVATSAFAWGALFHGWLVRRRHERARQHRIIVDAPFGPDQAAYLMEALRQIKNGVDERMAQSIAAKDRPHDHP